MASVTYAVVFSGQILDGHQAFSSQGAHVQAAESGCRQDAGPVLGQAGRPEAHYRQTAGDKIGTALKKIGADVKIKAIETTGAGRASCPALEWMRPPRRRISNLSVAPMEGYIVEPQPAPTPPSIDLSDLEIRGTR
ncbi:MAG: hypothetical protein U5O39_00325 [Gammaproteobacteria bacterium]|nr:hypothetical protein [Gammaproteobacteria bacterium]